MKLSNSQIENLSKIFVERLDEHFYEIYEMSKSIQIHSDLETESHEFINLLNSLQKWYNEQIEIPEIEGGQIEKAEFAQKTLKGKFTFAVFCNDCLACDFDEVVDQLKKIAAILSKDRINKNEKLFKKMDFESIRTTTKLYELLRLEITEPIDNCKEVYKSKTPPTYRIPPEAFNIK